MAISDRTLPVMALPVLVFVSSKASDWSSESRIRTVESDALEARSSNLVLKAKVLKLEKEVGPRFLSPTQKSKLLDAISHFPPREVSFVIQQGATDGELLAKDLWTVFNVRHWKLRDVRRVNIMGDQDGVTVRSAPNNKAVISAIANSLNSFGVEARPFVEDAGIYRSLTNEVSIEISYKSEK